MRIKLKYFLALKKESGFQSGFIFYLCFTGEMTCVPIAGNNPPVANNTWWRRLTTLPINYFQMILMETMREPLEGNGTQWWYIKHQKWERKKPWEYMKICWWGKDVFRLVGQGGGVQTVNNPHTAASRPTTKDFLCLSNPCPFSKKGSFLKRKCICFWWILWLHLQIGV